MLRLLEIDGAEVARPLLAGAEVIRPGRVHSQPTQVLRRTSKWHRHLKGRVAGDSRHREVAVMFHLRDAFRSGDIWLADSRRDGDMKRILVPARVAKDSLRLAVPLDPKDWLSDRRVRSGLEGLYACL